MRLFARYILSRKPWSEATVMDIARKAHTGPARKSAMVTYRLIHCFWERLLRQHYSAGLS